MKILEYGILHRIVLEYFKKSSTFFLLERAQGWVLGPNDSPSKVVIGAWAYGIFRPNLGPLGPTPQRIPEEKIVEIFSF